MKEIVVSMQHISKDFSGVKVLKDLSFNIYKGRVMALVGENGAGKSTLMKILTGVYLKTQGEIFLDNESVNFSDTSASQSKGIAIIHQELNLVKDLSIGENIFLGREPVSKGKRIMWNKLHKDAGYWLDKLGLKENPRELVKNISVGKQQLVEIAKALSIDAKVIIMDEPTGALTPAETDKLFDVISDLKKSGKSIVYISHRLHEIFEICDDVTVLRDGELIGEESIENLDEDKIIEMMVGRKLSEQYPRIETEQGEEILKVDNLSNEFVKDVSFSLKKGETLGVAGLMGSERTELMRSIYGIYPAKGSVYLNGEKIKINSPQDSLRHGIAYVTEDRKANGIITEMNVRENITLSSLELFKGTLGFMNKGKEEISSNEYIEKMSIKTSGTKQMLRFLSGGNQQKVSIAKSLMTNPKILILDEPTRGVDVGAKKEIYDLINKFKSEGMSIIMVSSDIPEVLGISDRIMVMHEGRVSGFLNSEEATQEIIMTLAVGKDVI
ncbi:ribose transport system ATP-binding protein [Sedimentibacter acidaminivorans]|uniref:Ribose transport system ATP-binding protein n=1 Tax=Sedimentibacter acidaminivorans TaxID=913099 RepID=A0ABS4GAF8_9FIRM|nr:ribose transport system ATP-binding protein [Sedimentibacter acidaminivorans]